MHAFLAPDIYAIGILMHSDTWQHGLEHDILWNILECNTGYHDFC
jgi:hypothetical protein